MKKLIYSAVWILLVAISVAGCKEDEPALGAIPTPEEAEFTFEPTEASANDIVFTNTAPGIKKWEFSDGVVKEGNTVTKTFIFKGEYTVTLTIYGSGGSVSTQQTVEIAQTDLSKLPPVYTYLTGGIGYPEGKTWIIDATRNGHMGLGPKAGKTPEWWTAKANEKAGSGLYNDKYTFKLDGFEYVQATDGDIFLNKDFGVQFPESYENAGDRTSPYEDKENLKWTIVEGGTDENRTYTLNLTNSGFIGFYTGVSSYEILSISEEEMFVKFYDALHPEFAWYHRLIPEGFEPPPPATSTLPIDFEGAKPPFDVFGGTAYDVIANPFSGGINTSAKVAKYVKGMEGNWAGMITTLSSKLDFSAKTIMKYKVYSPVAGKALFKLETSDGSADPVEVFGTVTKVNEWEEISFDFAGTPSDVYDRFAIFLDFDNNNGGTFHFDDIRQVAEEAPLTLDALTGGVSKVWKLKASAGSFGVGPAKGSDSWWPNGANISGDRPCLFNDEFIFKSGNVYQYDSKGDIWGEPYMGLADGCTNQDNLPLNAQAWGSGTHSFTFTPAVGSTPATIAVTGTGAFIALPKAFNGGEYTAAPPVADRTVTYEVLSYVKVGSTETLSLTLDYSGNGTGYWNFVLVAQ
jgi:PKD repeat protein